MQKKFFLINTSLCLLIFLVIPLSVGKILIDLNSMRLPLDPTSWLIHFYEYLLPFFFNFYRWKFYYGFYLVILSFLIGYFTSLLQINIRPLSRIIKGYIMITMGLTAIFIAIIILLIFPIFILGSSL
ncbi:MAG: hypothetical protein WCJ58_02820 [bacterium]